MHRLQISLTERQYEFLKCEAFVTRGSMAAVLRNLLDEVIQARQQDILDNDPIWEVVGIGADIEGPTDISTNVDKYLYGEALADARIDLVPKVAEATNEYDTD